jgi:hypothetical protein
VIAETKNEPRGADDANLERAAGDEIEDLQSLEPPLRCAC